jgi:hypothetical protein
MSPGTSSSLVRSPSQTNHFYSPPNKSGPFYKPEQYSGPPQTPPQFTQATLAHSPHYGPHPIVPSPLPAINGHGAHPQEPAQHYQANTGSPPYQLQRTYSGQLISAQNLPAIGGTQPSHAHPVSRQGSLIRSPEQEHEQDLNSSSNGVAAQDITAPMTRSTNQEVGNISTVIQGASADSPPRNLQGRMTPCPLPASCPTLPQTFGPPPLHR